MGKSEKTDNYFKRLFIGVKVYPENSFMDWHKQIKEVLHGEEIRWTRPENFHITLRFLGDTGIESITGISLALNRSVVSCKPFSFSLSGIGVFRSLSHPRVFWTGIKKTEGLNLIKESVDFQLKSIINLNETGSFKPHLTLGRMKKIYDLKIWKKLISSYSDYDFISVDVEEIILYESILNKTGPVYKVIEAIPLPP